MPSKRLRVAFVQVQPVLLWDDGTNLSPGPATSSAQVPLADLLDGTWKARLQAEMDQAEAALAGAEAGEDPE